MSPTGLAIEIIAKGDSKLPSENSNVVVKYTGKLVDGTVFDSTDKHGGAPAEFNLGRVIPGFREGLQKIGKGGKARLYIRQSLDTAIRQSPESRRIPLWYSTLRWLMSIPRLLRLSLRRRRLRRLPRSSAEGADYLRYIKQWFLCKNPGQSFGIFLFLWAQFIKMSNWQRRRNRVEYFENRVVAQPG